MKKLSYLIILIAVLSCKKDPSVVEPESGQYEGGLILLNEGLYQQNNASISFYSFSEAQVYQQVFYHENNRGLGDTANDLVFWDNGDSLFAIVAVDVSSQIEIIHAASMKSVTQIGLFDGANAREPRSLQVYGDKLFSCNFDGTVSVIDLNTKVEIANFQVGSNPDGCTAYGSKLYVSNSGGLNFPDYDSTISVVNMVTFTEMYKIPSRINCGPMIVDGEGEMYVLSRGNHSNIQPSLLRFNCQSDTLIDSISVNMSSWDYFGDQIYYYDTQLNGIYTYNTLTESSSSNALIDCSSYQTMFSISVTNAGIFTSDANGYVNSSNIRCYDLQGNFQYQFTAGLNTKKIEVN